MKILWTGPNLGTGRLFNALGLRPALILFSALLVSPPALGLEIVTSIKPLQLITLALVAPTDKVQVLVPDGASPHTYHLKPSDVRRLAAADLLIWVGEDLESNLARLVRPPHLALSLPLAKEIQQGAAPRLGDSGAARDARPHDHDDDHQADEAEHGHDDDHQADEAEPGHDHDDKHQADEDEHEHDHSGDPHFWLSPRLVALAAEHIHAELVRLNPDKKPLYATNLARFQAELSTLQAELAQRLVPVKQRGFITTHDAYSHLATAFDLNYVGYILVSPAAGYSAANLARLRQDLEQKKAVCLLREPQINERGLTSLSRGLDVQLGVLDPLASAIAATPRGYAHFMTALTNDLIRCLT